MIPNNIRVVRSNNKGCTQILMYPWGWEACPKMALSGNVGAKSPGPSCCHSTNCHFLQGIPMESARKTWIKRNGSTPRYGSKLGNPPSKHGWSWLGPRSKWRFLEGEAPMADFSNGSWWISSFASGSCRKSIRNGGFTIKKWWFCHQQNGVEPRRNGFSLIYSTFTIPKLSQTNIISPWESPFSEERLVFQLINSWLRG